MIARFASEIEITCRDRELRRVNYEVLGNAEPWLHGHVHPRYDWELAERIAWTFRSRHGRAQPAGRGAPRRFVST